MTAPSYIIDSNVADLVRLIKEGAVYLLDTSDVFTDPTVDSVTNTLTWTPPTGKTPIGYYSEDGLTIHPEPGDSNDFNGHNGDNVLTDTLPGYWTLQFAALQGNADAVAAYFDADVSSTDGSVAITKASADKRWQIVVAGMDQRERLIIVHAPITQINDRDDLTLNRQDLANLNMTFRTYKTAGADGYQLKAWGLVTTAAA